MGFKDILLQIEDSRGQDSRLRLAVALARRHKAQLTALFGLEPLGPGGLVGPAAADIAALQPVDDTRELRLAQRRAVGDRLRGAFEDAAGRAGVAALWRAREGDLAELAVHHARFADLVILGQADPDDPAPSPDVVAAVLLSAGRPVLVIPFIGSETLAQRVLIAWRSTREAARAVNDALPLLAEAESVTILSVNPARDDDGAGEEAVAAVAAHLARHGIKAEPSHIVTEDMEVGEALLSRAADLDSDLIVMGGYGHSRLREFALGGTTRTLLRHMTVPVLLSH